jgi:hypothetical protein
MFPANSDDWSPEDYLKHIGDYRRWLDNVSNQAAVSIRLFGEIRKDLDKLEKLIKKNRKKVLSKRKRKRAAALVYWIDIKAIKLLTK